MILNFYLFSMKYYLLLWPGLRLFLKGNYLFVQYPEVMISHSFIEHMPFTRLIRDTGNRKVNGISPLPLRVLLSIKRPLMHKQVKLQ